MVCRGRGEGRLVVGGMNDELLAGHGRWMYAAMRTVRLAGVSR